METPITDNIKKYFRENSRDQVLKDWNATEAIDNVGITLENMEGNERLQRLDNFEKILIQNNWKQKHLTNIKSKYWFEKKFNFPIFEEITISVFPEIGLVSLKVNGKNSSADIDFKDITNYKKLITVLAAF